MRVRACVFACVRARVRVRRAPTALLRARHDGQARVRREVQRRAPRASDAVGVGDRDGGGAALRAADAHESVCVRVCVRVSASACLRVCDMCSRITRPIAPHRTFAASTS